MSEVYYTHGMWRVKPSKEAEFIEAWKALGDLFRALPNPPGPGQGILIQNVADPLLFSSVGPWHSSEDLAAMRANPQAQAGIKRLEDLCDEGVRGTYRLVAGAAGCYACRRIAGTMGRPGPARRGRRRPASTVRAIHDPRHREPRDCHRDRWPVEPLPLAAKQMLGAARQLVHAPEVCRRLPALTLLAGAVLS